MPADCSNKEKKRSGTRKSCAENSKKKEKRGEHASVHAKVRQNTDFMRKSGEKTGIYSEEVIYNSK